MIKTKIKVACNQVIEYLRQKESYSNNNCNCKPTDINFLVTSKCNLKCRYCNYWKTKTNNEITIKEWKKIVIDFKKWSGSYHLTISGGEPLLFEGLFDLIRFASENEILVTLVTNGTLIDKNIAKKIVKSGVYNLIFSLDGLKEANDLIRGRGSYDKIISGIRILKKLKETHFLSLATVISNRNLNEITSMVEYVKDNGLNLIYVQPLTSNPKSDYDNDWHMKSALWPKDTEKVDSIIDELIVMKRKNYPIANPVNQLKSMKDYFKNPTFFKNKCFVGVKNCNIDETGNITTCFKMKPIGNVKIHKIDEIWHSKKADGIRKKIKNCKKGCSILNCNYTKSPIDKLRRLF